MKLVSIQSSIEVSDRTKLSEGDVTPFAGHGGKCGRRRNTPGGGGSTVFPAAQGCHTATSSPFFSASEGCLEIFPSRGLAALWHNTKACGCKDPASLHSGLPITQVALGSQAVQLGDSARNCNLVHALSGR